MFILRGLLAAGLALALNAALFAAPNPNAGNGGSRHAIQGTIVKVHHNRKHRGSGWIMVRRTHHHRRGVGAAAAFGRNRGRRGGQISRFAFNSSTRFDHLGRGRNGAASVNRTSSRSLRTGHRVRVLPGSPQHHAAREVAILSYSSNRSANRRSYGNNSNNGRRYSHRRNSLIGSRYLAHQGRPQYYRTNRQNRSRTMVTRPVRHSLVQGRVTRQTQHHHRGRQALTAAMKNQINQAVKRDLKKDLHPVHKHQATTHKTSTKHAVAKRPAPKHTHSSGHAKPAAHRKR